MSLRIALSLTLTFWSSIAAYADAQTNLVSNGDFEQGGAGWRFSVNSAKASGKVDSSEKHSGKFSYKLTNKSPLTPNVFARVSQDLPPLRPFTTYRISCWAKGKGCGINWLGGGPGWATRKWFPQGDFDWQEVSCEFTTGDAPDTFELMVLTESPTEALWVDDIRFEPVKTDVAKQAAVDTELTTKVEALRQRVSDVQTRAAAANLSASPYLNLGIDTAQRFLDFVQNGRTSLAWSRMELEEVSTVLDDTERLLKNNPSYLNWQPLKPGPVKMKNGLFYEAGRPRYFAGYGHFSSVIKDLPNFPALGASLIQDATTGPSSINADGSLREGAVQLLQGLDRAARYNMREDFLLSPHYLPEWVKSPDVANNNIGFLHYNLFHPEAKAAVQKWIEVMSANIKNKPALHSVCLANEPVYISSGRDTYTKPLFVEYLKHRHHDLAELNALYGTSYKTFDEVALPAPAMPATVPAQRAFYDWTCFNKQMFADWHAWLDSIVKKNGVTVPTHTKIMVFQTLDRNKLAHGVDPELMCRATDLAGCDAYAFPGGAYAYDWTGNEFFYDLLHSFRGQGVFNSENHVIPDGASPYHIPMGHTRSVLWQGGLHHQISTTIWVWEVAADPSLVGSIYFRPANVYGAGRAMFDLDRLAPEVTALSTAPARVALLYSQPSIFWEEKYKGSLMSLYTILNFMGENITFVSERQLAEHKIPKVKWIIAPNTTHVLASTPAALASFAKSGGKVLLVGKDTLGFDEYNRPLNRLADFSMIEPESNEPATAAVLRQKLMPLKFGELRDTAASQSAWGVEFRVVKFGRTTLIPLLNLNNDAKTVQLPGFAKRPALDLLSGEKIDLNSISVETMTPRLLQISE